MTKFFIPFGANFQKFTKTHAGKRMEGGGQPWWQEWP